MTACLKCTNHRANDKDYENCRYCREETKAKMAKELREQKPRVYIDADNLGHKKKIEIGDGWLKSKKTHREIAKICGCSYSTVYRRRRELRERELREREREREWSQVPMLGGGDFRRF